MQYDPWEQAALLANQLDNARADTHLVVAVGAGWCHKCDELRPLFDSLAEQSPSTDIFLWLDLDEHADFVGDYVPEDLPELLVYRQGRLCNRGMLREMSGRVALLREAPADLTASKHPDVWRRLTEPNWATGQSATVQE